MVVMAQISSGSVLLGPDRQQRARELVVGQREAEQRHADHAGQHDRQRPRAEASATSWRRGRAPLPRRTRLKRLKHGEHDQQAERQRPGEMRAKRRGVPVRSASPGSWKIRPMPRPTQQAAARSGWRWPGRRRRPSPRKRRRKAKPADHRDHHRQHHARSAPAEASA